MPTTTIDIIYEDKAKEKWDDDWDNKKWYSEEEVQELIRKSIQFERSKRVRKIFKKYFWK